MCYYAEFGRSVIEGEAYRRIRKMGEPCNSAVLGWEARLTPRYTPLSVMRYHVKFGSSATDGVRINWTEPTRSGSAGALPPCVGACLTCKKVTSQHVLQCQIWYFCDEACTHNEEETPKLGAMGPAALGWGVIDPQKNKPRPRVKFGSCVAKSVPVCINRREPQTAERCGTTPMRSGHGYPQNTILLFVCYTAELGHPRSNGTSDI